MLSFAFNTMFNDGLENRIIEFVGVLDVILLILWFFGIHRIDTVHQNHKCYIFYNVLAKTV